MWTLTLPVITTGHISTETRDLLSASSRKAFSYLVSRQTGEMPVCWVAEYSEGFFVRFWDEQEPEGGKELPQDLRDIRSWLVSAGYLDLWVRIDSDGDVVSGLNTFEW